MLRKVLLVSAVALVALAQGAFAGDHRFEITPTFGWTFSEGVEVNDREVPIEGGLIVTDVGPESGMSYGVGIDAYFRRDGMVGFNWSRQDSKFLADVRTAGSTELMDMNIDNFHGIFTYIREDLHPQAAPFVFGGLGATYYSFSDFLGREVDSETKFSTTWGVGVRVYPNERIGVKFTGRWTPTYIKTDTEGYWCDYYGCWTVGDSDYSHQFELSGSLMLLF